MPSLPSSLVSVDGLAPLHCVLPIIHHYCFMPQIRSSFTTRAFQPIVIPTHSKPTDPMTRVSSNVSRLTPSIVFEDSTLALMRFNLYTSRLVSFNSWSGTQEIGQGVSINTAGHSPPVEGTSTSGDESLHSEDIYCTSQRPFSPGTQFCATSFGPSCEQEWRKLVARWCNNFISGIHMEALNHLHTWSCGLIKGCLAT